MKFLKKISSNQQVLTDEQLLQLFKQDGNTEPLAILYMRYAELIYGICFKYLQNAESARDEVMAIYEELPSKVEKHSILNFKNWIYSVAKNHCLMILRNTKDIRTLNFDPRVVHFDEKLHPEDSSEQKEEEFILLDECLKKLIKDQQQTISLFYLQQKCYNEIVALTGFEWSKVRSLIQNGRRNLKICMDHNKTKTEYKSFNIF